jgi:hypothetical protein
MLCQGSFLVSRGTPTRTSPHVRKVEDACKQRDGSYKPESKERSWKGGFKAVKK